MTVPRQTRPAFNLLDLERREVPAVFAPSVVDLLPNSTDNQYNVAYVLFADYNRDGALEVATRTF